MKGIGSTAIELPGGLVVAALVAVKRGRQRRRSSHGTFHRWWTDRDGRSIADLRTLLRSSVRSPERALENTTPGVVATNATLTKAQAAGADGAMDTRARLSGHLTVDGDAICARDGHVRTGRHEPARRACADAVVDAIVRAVRPPPAFLGILPRDLNS
jgi:L-aminopeptidase/D-esterase-like protein